MPTAGTDCGAGAACVDGYCCDRACDTGCEACDLPGQEGICSLLPAGADSRGACDASAAATCGERGTCDGAGACELHGLTTVCDHTECPPSSCDELVFTGYPDTCSHYCDGAGACLRCACANFRQVETCDTGEGNTCCAPACDAEQGCSTTADDTLCPDLCAEGEDLLTVGRTCSGCGPGGAAGACDAGDAHSCTGPADQCSEVSCGGDTWFCTETEAGWGWRTTDACDDGNACTGAGTCAEGTCVAAPLNEATPCEEGLCREGSCEGALCRIGDAWVDAGETDGACRFCDPDASRTAWTPRPEGFEGTCSPTACPADGCVGNVHQIFAEECVNTCDAVGACTACSCSPAETSCEAGGCCVAQCDAATGCSSAAGSCPDLCEAGSLLTGRSCTGCGSAGATGTCGPGLQSLCDASSACMDQSCGGATWQCRHSGGTWSWTTTDCEGSEFCHQGACVACTQSSQCPSGYTCEDGRCESLYLFFEDWEDGSWSRWIPGDGSVQRSVTTAHAAGGTQYSFEIRGRSQHYQGVHRTVSGLQPSRISWWVRTTSHLEPTGYFVLSQGTGIPDPDTQIAFVFFDTNGQIRIGGPGTDLQGYAANTWYHLEMRDIDWGLRRYNMYVNGVRRATNVSFRNDAMNRIDRIDLYNFGGEQSQSWWDEIFFFP